MNRPRLLFALAAACGLAPGGPPAGPGSATKPAERTIVVDRRNRQVTVEAAVSLQEGLLEFLLCREGTKDYESLLVTKAQPSALHAALLALGLVPGKPAQWSTPPGKEPVFLPPRGALLDISLRWTDSEGKAREVPAHKWLLSAGKKQPAPETRWVFVGSDFLENGQYWADAEGQFISVANFAASVVDVPFQSSDKNAFLEFTTDPKAVPPKGTPVQVVIRPLQGAETAPVARVTFQVDQLGRIEMDGQPVAPADIAPAIRRFLSRHAEGCADVRLDARALVFDQERLKAILQEAGMTDIVVKRLALDEEIPPRTAAEAAEAVAWWKDQFARAEELITDPAEAADEAVKRIEQRRKELQALSELWSDYARQVRALAEDYRRKRQAASQPQEPK